MAKKPEKESEIEFESDAWERFGLAVSVVVKSPPQHREESVPEKNRTKAKKVKKAKPGK